MDSERIRQILESVKEGNTTVDTALQSLKVLPFEDLGFARVDHHRALRQGIPEVVYCPGKTDDQIVSILEKLTKQSHRALATRASVSTAALVAERLPDVTYHQTARIIAVTGELPAPVHEPGAPGSCIGTVLVASAGTADIPVAEEAAVTLTELGSTVERLYDVGVAGLHRLLSRHETLMRANVVVVVAGMEGALASVVGGLVARPVIAVPTSIGYGASLNGISALLTMLNSCASGVGVVNIDNGFGAAFLAHRINQVPGYEG
jgi:NCAIR mutase (PurE)-related protein